ncbi:MAG: hypothetical protein AAGB27_03720 [Pseudomonadota bacterium]
MDKPMNPMGKPAAASQPGLLIAVALLLSAAGAAAQTDGTVTCVAGDQKAWRCSRDGTAPEAAPLPELKPTQAAVPTPDVFRIPDPADDPTQTVSPIDALMPMPAAPVVTPANQRARDVFTLKIASVSEVDEIPGFVDSFGLDPALVRYMAVIEGDKARQLILWGSFVTPVQASRAVVAMPNAVQAMRPQIAEVAKLTGTLYDYSSLAAGQAPTEPLVAATAPSRPAAGLTASPTAGPAESPAPTRAPVANPPVTPEPIAEVSPVTNDEDTDRSVADVPGKATAADESEPAPATNPAPALAEAPTMASAEPADLAPTTTLDAIAAEPQTPAATEPETAPAAVDRPAPVTQPSIAESPRVQGRPAPTEPTDTAGPATLEAAEPADEIRPQPAPQPTRAEAVPSRSSRANVIRETAARERPARPSAAAVTAPPAPKLAGAGALSTLDPGAFVIQLTSLSKPELLGLYLRRHELSAQQLIAVSLDEGAGTRVLLLKGGYNSLASAEAALTELPASIRSPWIRTVAPLQKALNQP